MEPFKEKTSSPELETEHLYNGLGTDLSGAPIDDSVPVIDLTDTHHIEKFVGVSEIISSTTQGISSISQMTSSNKTEIAQNSNLHTSQFVFHRKHNSTSQTGPKVLSCSSKTKGEGAVSQRKSTIARNSPIYSECDRKIVGWHVSGKLDEESGITRTLKPIYMSKTREKFSFSSGVKRKGMRRNDVQNTRYSYIFGSNYPCKVCHRHFKRHEHLTKHLISHKKDKQKKNVCGGHYVANRSVSVIRRNFGKASVYTCTVCKKSFIAKKHLDNHLNLHTGKEKDYTYKCKTCNETFLRYRSLVLHKYTFHSSTEYTSKLLTPDSIPQMSHSKRVINTPTDRRTSTSTSDIVDKYSKKTKLNVCIICDTAFTDSVSFRQHLSRRCAPVKGSKVIRGLNDTFVEVCPKKINGKDVSNSYGSEREDNMNCTQDLVSANMYMCALCKTGLVGSVAFRKHLSLHRANSEGVKDRTSKRIYDKDISNSNVSEREDNTNCIQDLVSTNVYMCTFCKTGLVGSVAFRKHLSMHRANSEGIRDRSSSETKVEMCKQNISNQSSSNLLFSENDFEFQLSPQQPETEKSQDVKPDLSDIKKEPRERSRKSLFSETDFESDPSLQESEADKSQALKSELSEIKQEPSERSRKSLFSEYDFEFDLDQQE